MKNLFIALILISFTSCLVDKKKEVNDDTWTTIWNGNDFEGWHTYLGPPFQIRTDSLGNTIEPFGIDNDPLEVITIVPTS